MNLNRTPSPSTGDSTSIGFHWELPCKLMARWAVGHEPQRTAGKQYSKERARRVSSTLSNATAWSQPRQPLLSVAATQMRR